MDIYLRRNTENRFESNTFVSNFLGIPYFLTFTADETDTFNILICKGITVMHENKIAILYTNGNIQTIGGIMGIYSILKKFKNKSFPFSINTRRKFLQTILLHSGLIRVTIITSFPV